MNLNISIIFSITLVTKLKNKEVVFFKLVTVTKADNLSKYDYKIPTYTEKREFSKNNSTQCIFKNSVFLI